mmetsp:Transcript_11968/g.20207  ORF Transcript_11968/g.20207 Transcript_11968/m.20207 type:complete len:340 (-) Transcript_11968:600-1619(-)
MFSAAAQEQVKTSKEEGGGAEKKFDYSKMDHYEILDVPPTADEKQVKIAYIKAAKKFHPDVYNGVNQQHFTKVNEVYAVLKNPIKRKEYDRKMKILKMRDSDEYKSYAQRQKMKGNTDFSYSSWRSMKRQRKEKIIREELDPEFHEAFKKLNIEQLFAEFNARPLRSSMGEMAESFMQMDMERKMSRRDKARAKFVRDHKIKQLKKKNLRNVIITEQEHYYDFREQIDGFNHTLSSKSINKMEFDELVEFLNKDTKNLTALSGQKNAALQLFKEETQVVKEEEEKRDETVKEVKRVIYPIYLLFAAFISLIWLGEAQQRKTIARGSERREIKERFKNYQ